MSATRGWGIYKVCICPGSAQKSAWVGCNGLCLTKCERKRWCVIYGSLTAAKMGVIDEFCRRRDGSEARLYTKFVYPLPSQPLPWLMSSVVSHHATACGAGVTAHGGLPDLTRFGCGQTVHDKGRVPNCYSQACVTVQFAPHLVTAIMCC
jgi:hypothetical protein